jgi:hypothetical protein
LEIRTNNKNSRYGLKIIIVMDPTFAICRGSALLHVLCQNQIRPSAVLKYIIILGKLGKSTINKIEEAFTFGHEDTQELYDLKEIFKP